MPDLYPPSPRQRMPRSGRGQTAQVRTRWRALIAAATTGIAMAAAAVAPTAIAATAWTNGQAATLVIGADDLTTLGGGTASATRFSYPGDVCVDRTSGAVFVVSNSENRILRFPSAEAMKNGGTADAVFGQPDFTSTTDNHGGRSAASLYQPVACVVDDAGNMFVADSSNNRVLRFNNAAHKVFSESPPVRIEADAVLGQSDFVSKSTETISATRMKWGSTSLAISPQGALYAADGGNNRILRFNNAATKANGAPADGVLGAPDFNTPGSGVISPEGFSVNIAGMSVDSAGSLYVGDLNFSRVLRFDAADSKSGLVSADAVLGQSTFTGSATGISQSTFRGIRRVAVMPDGALYVADHSGHRVLVFNDAANKTNGANADHVLGQPNFTSGVVATSAAGLSSPVGLAHNPVTGHLLISDVSNRRVVGHYQASFVKASPAAPDPGIPASGQSTVLYPGQSVVITGDGGSGGTTLRVPAQPAGSSPTTVTLPNGDRVEFSSTGGAELRVVRTVSGQYALAVISGTVRLAGTAQPLAAVYSQRTGVVTWTLGSSAHCSSAGGAQISLSGVTTVSVSGCTEFRDEPTPTSARAALARGESAGPATAQAFTVQAATQAFQLLAGEQARFDSAGQLIGLPVLGTATGGKAGDRSPLPSVAGLTVQAQMPILNATASRNGQNLLESLRAQAQGYGLQLSGPSELGSLTLTDAQGQRYSVGALVPVEVDVHASRPEGASTNAAAHGLAALTQQKISITLDASVADLAALASTLHGLGASTTLQEDASLFVQWTASSNTPWAGQRWALLPQAAIQSGANGAAALNESAQGQLAWTDAQGRMQALLPTAVDFAWVRSLLQAQDASVVVRRELDGRITAEHAGQRYTLTPDRQILQTPAERVFDQWWMEGGKLYVRYPGRGMTQAFTVR